jgi:5-methylcytosine-specific restriction enzyme A
MAFNPGLEKNQVIGNSDLRSVFKCSPQGRMRRSYRTKSLVLVSNHTGGIYPDRYTNRIYHYVGMGLTGDQDINRAQNKTLAKSLTNGVNVYLFEVLKRKLYTYRGEVKLAGKPYQATQPDKDGNNRLVWIFPLKVI